jgi:ankyrin repeat protein
MDQSLRDAALQGSINALYALIKKDPAVLDSIDQISFVETPLHTAASAGKIQFAMEIMRLKPSFARKLDEDGFTPMHIALQKFNASYQNEETDLRRNQALLVNQLLSVNKDLARVQGREGLTPLHYVAETGVIYFLEKNFKVCPESFEDVTNLGENVMHIALKNDNIYAFKHMLRMVQQAWFKDASFIEKKLLCWQDAKDNTLLHVAVAKNQTKASNFHSSFLVEEDRVGIMEIYHVVQRGDS